MAGVCFSHRARSHNPALSWTFIPCNISLSSAALTWPQWTQCILQLDPILVFHCPWPSFPARPHVSWSIALVLQNPWLLGLIWCNPVWRVKWYKEPVTHIFHIHTYKVYIHTYKIYIPKIYPNMSSSDCYLLRSFPISELSCVRMPSN